MKLTGIGLSVLFLATFLLPGAAVSSAKDWEKLEDCRLKLVEGNDGDSFHVLQGNKEYIFRLYFVDTPETSNEYPERVKDQSDYFRLKEKETLKVGKDAQAFTRKFLSGGPFVVHTCWEDARGDSSLPRYYAIVEKDYKSLIEALAAEGLVRIYGMPTKGNNTPISVPPDRYISRLKRLENDAQRDHLGGWRRSGDVAGKNDKPDKPEPAAAATININTATAEELDALPGLGPVLVQRIIEGRPYAGPEDLSKVNGIGAALLEKLKPSIRFAD